jgi:hypothetical protein
MISMHQQYRRSACLHQELAAELADRKHDAAQQSSGRRRQASASSTGRPICRDKTPPITQGTLCTKSHSESLEVLMKPKTAARLRDLAQTCVTAARCSTDEDAATALLDVASSLIDLANGKVTSQKTAEPALN